MANRKSKDLIRPLVRRLQPYVPGEQPKIKGLIKLNTNENPYPPSPKVRAAVKAATDGRLRLYPNPTAQKLREALARFHGCGAENIIVGNGSDELLAMAVRCFVETRAVEETKIPNSNPDKSGLRRLSIQHPEKFQTSNFKLQTSGKLQTSSFKKEGHADRLRGPAFVKSTTAGKREERCMVQFFTPSYSLYPVLAEAHGAVVN